MLTLQTRVATVTTLPEITLFMALILFSCQPWEVHVIITISWQRNRREGKLKGFVSLTITECLLCAMQCSETCGYVGGHSEQDLLPRGGA